ncbi:MAG TPA: PAS domain S-box protein [Ignavibacteria bacterium]
MEAELTTYPQPKADRFKNLIERLNVITYEFDIQKHRFVYVSRQAESILGYKREKWLNQGFWYEHLHPEDRKWALAFSRKQTALLNDHEFEYRMIAADNSIIWIKDITSVYTENDIPKMLQGVLVDITERKTTENELRESKERYQTLVEQQTEMITRWKPDGSFTYVNDVFCSFFGKKREELIGNIFVPDMPKEDKIRFRKFFSKLSAQNPIGQFTHRVIMPGGETRFLRWTDKAITDKAGNIIEYQTIGRDITDRMLAEEALRRSEKNLFAIFENAPIGMLIVSLEGKLLRVNKAFCSILGYNKEELERLTFQQITHPDDLERYLKLYRETLEGKRSSYSIEKRYLKKDGSVVFANLHVNITYKDNNEPDFFIAQIADITEKKNAEEKLHETQVRLGTLLNNLHDIVFYETSPEGTFITDNIADMIGYSSKELSENKGLFLSLIHPDDKPKVDQTVEIWNKFEENTFNKIEIRIKRKDGTYIWIEDRMFAVKADNKFYWAGFMLDITERKQSEIKLAETEHRLSSILNNLTDVVFYENEKELLFISDNIYEMLGYKSQQFITDKALFAELMHQEDRRKVYDRVDEWIKKGESDSIKSEFRITRKDGTYLWVEDHMFAVETDSRKYWAGFFVDVTDRKIAEEKLEETKTRLTTIIDNLTNLTVYETGGGKYYVSENIEKITGYPVSEFYKDKGLFVSLLHPEDLKVMDENIKEWHKGGANGAIINEFRILQPGGEYFWIEDHMFRIKNEKGEEYLSGIMIDITEKKKALEKIQDTEIRLSTILNNLPKIVIYQAGKGKDFISENISEMIGYSPEEIFKEPYFFGGIMHPDDIPLVKDKLKVWKSQNEQDVLSLEYRLRKKDGEYVWIEDHMFKVTTANHEPYFSGILIDVTERKLTEQKITQSLKEKEVLLKEIHHRVKNNLQVVSSLLKLQSSFLDDKHANNILLESHNRVRSMALVHQKLYQSENFAKVDFADYVKQLTLNLMDVYKHNAKKIFLNVEADPVLIGVDIAIPCGLIINELVSNSLKYAFINIESGRVDIILNSLQQGSYKIEIKDNGVGFPGDIDFRKTKSLGLQLVTTLVKQIDGKIEMQTGSGTSFVIMFKDPSQTD